MTETQKNKRAWVSYIFPANFIFYLETCCDTFHEHFRSSKYRITHPNYSSTTYIDYTLYTVKLQRQLPFQITFALYDLNDALSYSRMSWRFRKVHHAEFLFLPSPVAFTIYYLAGCNPYLWWADRFILLACGGYRRNSRFANHRFPFRKLQNH